MGVRSLFRYQQLLSGIKEDELLCSHPYKAGREPALAVHDATPPPLLVGSIHYFDDITGLEAQLLIIHGDVVPEGLSIHHTAIADQLQGKQRRHSTRFHSGGTISEATHGCNLIVGNSY